MKVLETLDRPSPRNPTFHLISVTIGSTASTSSQERRVSVHQLYKAAFSAHELPRINTHGMVPSPSRPVLLYWPLNCRGASRPASCTLCRRFMARPPQCDGAFLWMFWAVFETWPTLTRQKSSGLPSFLSLPFVRSDPVAPR